MSHSSATLPLSVSCFVILRVVIIVGVAANHFFTVFIYLLNLSSGLRHRLVPFWCSAMFAEAAEVRGPSMLESLVVYCYSSDVLPPKLELPSNSGSVL